MGQPFRPLNLALEHSSEPGQAYWREPRFGGESTAVVAAVAAAVVQCRLEEAVVSRMFSLALPCFAHSEQPAKSPNPRLVQLHGRHFVD